MILIAGMMSALGLVAIVSQGTFLRMLIGIQLLFQGASVLFVLLGISKGLGEEGTIFSFFVLVGSIALLITGYALWVRAAFLDKKTLL